MNGTGKTLGDRENFEALRLVVSGLTSGAIFCWQLDRLARNGALRPSGRVTKDKLLELLEQHFEILILRMN